ncbi:MAG: hypothetical protein M1457_13475 [bacterium]|nr:hypothetical protein [bacterium]
MSEKKSRVVKLYASLDILVMEFQSLLIAELAKDEYSSFLHRSRDDLHVVGRLHVIQGRCEDLKHANELLGMEKQIRQLCEKLDESQPLPIAVLDEYVESYRLLKKQKTKVPWHTDDFESEHKRLRKQLIQKLLG